jgi:hypothetical protein
MQRSGTLLVGIVLLTACASEPGATGATATTEPRATATVVKGEPLGADVQRDLATLRAATAKFHRFAEVREAEYTFLFMNACMVDESGQNLGGMGYHFVNTELLDGTVDVSTPEAIMYEPEANGQLRLVGVEYVIPAAAWTSTTTKPTLFGREFTLNAFGLWALHVWAWKDNPGTNGIFADWNPNVSCENAPAVPPQ